MRNDYPRVARLAGSCSSGRGFWRGLWNKAVRGLFLALGAGQVLFARASTAASPEMEMNKRLYKRGFTLIEMLIVIVVIGILAVIVIPRLLGAGRKSKEASLRADLKQLRDAVEEFEANTAAWPPDLADLMAADGAAISADSDGRGMSVDRGGYTGPYLSTGNGDLPNDPFTGTTDWTYDNSTGVVHSASTLTTPSGEAYSAW